MRTAFSLELLVVLGFVCQVWSSPVQCFPFHPNGSFHSRIRYCRARISEQILKDVKCMSVLRIPCSIPANPKVSSSTMVLFSPLIGCFLRTPCVAFATDLSVVDLRQSTVERKTSLKFPHCLPLPISLLGKLGLVNPCKLQVSIYGVFAPLYVASVIVA